MKILVLCLVLLLGAMPLRAADLPDARFFHRHRAGDVAAAREWLDAGLPPDFEGNVIGTGLMIGAWEGNIPMMELFALARRGHQQGPTRAASRRCCMRPGRDSCRPCAGWWNAVRA
jgi:hypothetical protein